MFRNQSGIVIQALLTLLLSFALRPIPKARSGPMTSYFMLWATIMLARTTRSLSL
jgi:hypothetical protein